MQECTLDYIPDRLVMGDKPVIDTFEVGEYLYRRCHPADLENPFRTISPIELSHNRAGLKQEVLCNPDDVLFSINEGEEFHTYESMVVCTLEIKTLTQNNIYCKQYTQKKDEKDITATLELLHDPEPCMYPHSVFRVKINGETITLQNYKETLKKLNEIRNQIKDEIVSMIKRREVSQDYNPK